MRPERKRELRDAKALWWTYCQCEGLKLAESKELESGSGGPQDGLLRDKETEAQRGKAPAQAGLETWPDVDWIPEGYLDDLPRL